MSVKNDGLQGYSQQFLTMGADAITTIVKTTKEITGAFFNSRLGAATAWTVAGAAVTYWYEGMPTKLTELTEHLATRVLAVALTTNLIGQAVMGMLNGTPKPPEKPKKKDEEIATEVAMDVKKLEQHWPVGKDGVELYASNDDRHPKNNPEHLEFLKFQKWRLKVTEEQKQSNFSVSSVASKTKKPPLKSVNPLAMEKENSFTFYDPSYTSAPHHFLGSSYSTPSYRSVPTLFTSAKSSAIIEEASDEDSGSPVVPPDFMNDECDQSIKLNVKGKARYFSSVKSAVDALARPSNRQAVLNLALESKFDRNKNGEQEALLAMDDNQIRRTNNLIATELFRIRSQLRSSR